MSEERDEYSFEDLRPYIGEAIQSVRRVRERRKGKTKEELADMLSATPLFEDKPRSFLQAVEDGIFELSFEELEIFCQAIEFPLDIVLRTAKLVKEISERGDK